MSFTTTLKNELVNIESSKVEKISELAALINVMGEFNGKIKMTTENVSVAKRIFRLVKQIYQINCQITVRKGYGFSKKNIYLLEIPNNDILNDLGIETLEKQSIPADFIVEDEELKKAYLRGIFLAVGSINDPKKTSYHLEFVFQNASYASFIKDLLNSFAFNAKILEREKKHMIYIKEAEMISDFLKIIDAHGALFYFEDVRIYRDHKNMTNRLNNCEQANIDKVIVSADKQIAAIDKIKKEKLYDALDEKLQVVVDYRLKYPDASLNELTDIIALETGVKITKSGIYHRMKKIEDLALKIKK